MSPIVQFLKRILPATGWLCAANLTKDQRAKGRHVWAQTHEELAEKILLWDKAGSATYHACASFKEMTDRTQENVHRLKSFWVDADVGPKGYDTAEHAREASQEFCRKTGLPQPLYVGSGYGLHIYWPLDQEIDEGTWKIHAKALKALCKQHGFLVDPARTSDSASILRSPGTFNRKDPRNPKEVIWLSDTTPAALSSFPKEQNISSPPVGLAKALAFIDEGPPSNAIQMADLCAQVRIFRDTGGRMPEPDWKACLGAVAFCEGGIEICHEWSKGDERYNSFETESKIQASKALTGPTTCGHFDGLNNHCVGCPFKGQITSPVELGRGVPKLTPAQVEFAQTIEDEIELPKVGSFSHVGGALVFVSENKQGREVYTRITQYPVIVESITKGELLTDSYSVVLKYKTPHEPWQTTAIHLRSLFGSSGIAEVMGKGIIVHNPELFKQYVRESMDQLNAQQRADMQYDQFGWKNDETEFLVGNRLYSAEGYRTCAGGKEVVRRSAGLGPAKNGSLAIWTDCINRLFASGFEAQGFAVLASFSAPFMRWQSHSEGGAIVSLVSRSGGKGKSTALTAAASVWGRLNAMSQITADTRVAKGIGLGVMGNLPMIRDEYTQKDPEILREEVEIFTAGRDKQRGTSEGGLINLGAEWQTVLITGSNNSLVDILTSGKNGAAMAGRVVEFIVDIPKNAAHWKGDKLKDTIAANCGYAGEAFLQTILQPEMLAYLKDLVPHVREDIIKRHNLTSDRRFIARTLSGVAVAGHIVKDLGLIEFSVDRIMEWAQDVLFTSKAYIQSQMDNPLFVLAHFLSENLQNTLIMPDAQRGKTKMPIVQKPTRNLWVRHEVKPGKIYIDRKALRQWLQNEEVPWKPFMEDLHNAGVIINADKTVTLSAGTDMTTGQVVCVEVDALHPTFVGGVREVEGLKEQVG